MNELTPDPGPTPTARDFMRQICPPWLAHGWAEKLLYALAIQVDAFSDALTAAIKLRFPNYYSNDTLPLLGRERRIGRGLTEDDATYAGRLNRWLEDHRTRGGPYALLRQLYAFFSPFNFEAELIYRNGRRFHIDEAGTITTDIITWSPDTRPEQWARWWIVIYTNAFARPLTAQQIASLRIVPTEWNAAHCIGRIVLLHEDGELWNFPLGRKWNRPRKWNTPPTTQIAIE